MRWLFMIAAVAPLAAAAQPVAVQATPTTALQAAMTSATQDAAGAGLAGQILVGDRRGTLFSRAVSSPRQAHRPGELWRWASVTKQLTATLVMQAVTDRKLALDDTLATRLPAFHGPTAARITIRMLLQHQSGLPNPDDTASGTGVMPAFYRDVPPPAGNALGYCAGPAANPVADRFSYNNCDFIVLGEVLHHISGHKVAQLLREKIAAPLGLTSLRLAAPDEAPRTVAGFTEAGGREPAFLLGTFGASGAAIGTPEDLLAFDRALLTYRLLSKPASDVAWSGNPKLGYEALGVWSFKAGLRGCKAPVALVERRGEIGGIEVRNVLAPDIGRALVVFADRAGLPFGEVWQGHGLTYTLASAAFCT